MKYYLLILLSIPFLGGFALKEASTLSIKIRNIQPDSGPIYVAFSEKEEEFPGKSTRIKYRVIPQKGVLEATLEIKNLKPGKYAFSMYQDLNSDAQMNTNGIGFPIEPFAFSNNYRPRFMAPEFSKCLFDFNRVYQELVVDLIY